MAKLVLTFNGAVLDQHFIDKESISVGRGSDCDIVIRDPVLSREHVRIVSIGEDHIAEDLQSKNGTLLNGKPLTRQILQNRDVLKLGTHLLAYVNTRMAADIDLERTMLIQAVPRGTVPAEGSPVVAVPAMRPPKARLPEGQVTVEACPAGKHAVGACIRLERVVATFGTPGEQLVLLTRRPPGYFVTHVEGARQPYVNGKPLAAPAQLLRDGDLIDAAGYRLAFRLVSAAPA